MKITSFWNIIALANQDQQKFKLIQKHAHLFEKEMDEVKKPKEMFLVFVGWEYHEIQMRCRQLGQVLRALNPDEVKAFEAHFAASLELANNASIRQAAEILFARKLSELEFLTYRTVLVSCGESVFKHCTKDPAKLFFLQLRALNNVYFTVYGRIASHVYKEKTGLELVRDVTRNKHQKNSALSAKDAQVLQQSYMATSNQSRSNKGVKQAALDDFWMECCKTWGAMDLDSYQPYKLPLEYEFTVQTEADANKVAARVSQSKDFTFNIGIVDIPGYKTYRVICRTEKQLASASDLANWIEKMDDIMLEMGCDNGAWGFGAFDFEPVLSEERLAELEELEAEESEAELN